MQTIELNLDEETVHELNRLALQQQTTIEELIKQFIRDYLQENAKKQQ
ncbi:MAG: ribbon-helix-helix protein, CopG family [Pseudanabaenaceae cyanobacterium bins.39]|nr:ribbon-helix-helix protein, CopG family [Pseudanabaenaceae cyanobacterium bins.39]